MVTLQELQARHSPEKQARIRAFAEELLKTFEANHATYVNARKALEAAEKERRRQKALARKRARAEAAKLRAAKAKAAEMAAKAEEKTREKAKAKAAEASKEKTPVSYTHLSIGRMIEYVFPKKGAQHNGEQDRSARRARAQSQERRRRHPAQ